jgi:hypothetical protein
MKYRLAKDILIPAGTKVQDDPPHKSQRYTVSALITVAIDADTTAEWRMDLEEAIVTGLVEEVE